MKKIIIFIIIIITLITFLTFYYFYSVWDIEQDTEKIMINKAYSEVPELDSIVDIDLFSGDRQFYFILGKSAIGNDVLVWLNDNEINSKYLFNWVTKDEIKEKTLIVNPDITIMRIAIGINIDDTIIYEILFKDIEGRLGYQYYKLESGEFIKTYKLGKI